jgi:hypothetical protein
MLSVANTPAEAATVQGCTRGRSVWGGNCLSMKRNSATALEPQRGADGVDLDDECASGRLRARHKIRAQRAPLQAVSNLVELNKPLWV